MSLNGENEYSSCFQGRIFDFGASYSYKVYTFSPCQSLHRNCPKVPWLFLAKLSAAFEVSEQSHHILLNSKHHLQACRRYRHRSKQLVKVGRWGLNAAPSPTRHRDEESAPVLEAWLVPHKEQRAQPEPGQAPAAHPAEPGMPWDGEGRSWAHSPQKHGSHIPLSSIPLWKLPETVPVSSEHFQIYLERIT